MALALALQHFDVYLNTTQCSILVFTDHNPLTFIPKMKNHNQHLLEWELLLQEYHLNMQHIRGKEKNVVVDALPCELLVETNLCMHTLNYYI